MAHFAFLQPHLTPITLSPSDFTHQLLTQYLESFAYLIASFSTHFFEQPYFVLFHELLNFCFFDSLVSLI